MTTLTRQDLSWIVHCIKSHKVEMERIMDSLDDVSPMNRLLMMSIERDDELINKLTFPYDFKPIKMIKIN